MDITVIVIVCTVIIWGVYDIWTIAKRGKKTSISAYIIRASYKYPLAVLLLGMLLGHLFWSTRTDDMYPNIECKEVVNGANTDSSR
jgi:hypothetical protein